MGVMLSLDGHRPARGRRRPGQHARHPDNRALAAARRYDAPAGGRLLARLARTVLARRAVLSRKAVPAAGSLRDGGPA